jgi:hypothetical protein
MNLRNEKGDNVMGELKKVLVLDNEIEASLMQEILKEREIPYFVQSYQDSAYGGIFQFQKGWGHLEAVPKYHNEILSIYKELK